MYIRKKEKENMNCYRFFRSFETKQFIENVSMIFYLFFAADLLSMIGEESEEKSERRKKLKR